MRTLTKALVTAGATGALALAPTAAQAQVTQDGLVNLALTQTTVQVPIAVAANICGVAVNLLAQGLSQGDVDCQAEGATSASRENGGNGGNTRQEGLVNVAVTNTTVQVPVGIAANVCGVAVNVLATATNAGDIDCQAEGVAIAEA